MIIQLPHLYYSDRYCNEGTKNYSEQSEYTEAEKCYRPTSKAPWFALHPYQLPREEVTVFQAGIDSSLKKNYIGDGQVLFCVHPQVEEQAEKNPYYSKILGIGKRTEKPLKVAPSSSTRSLYVLEAPVPHCLKVHFPFQISRYGRKMRAEVIEQAVNVSRELEKHVEEFPENFAWLREGLGIVLNPIETDAKRGENWGYLVREMTPYPEADADNVLVPGFALYGYDFFQPETTPRLLLRLLENRDPMDYVLTQIMLPVVRQWIQAYRTLGYMLEPHGQNVLFAIDEMGEVRRVVHRDLSVGIDMRLRRDIGLSPDGLNSYNRMEDGRFGSITYDMFMGNHFFERLAAFCQEIDPTLQAEDFRTPCRDEFARCFPEHTDYLPDTVYYFSSKRDIFNKPFYESTGIPPRWRP